MANKKPVGMFCDKGILILVIPMDDESSEAAIKRVAEDHNVDPSKVSPYDETKVKDFCSIEEKEIQAPEPVGKPQVLGL